MNNIVNINTIIKNEIDENNYFESLLSILIKYEIIKEEQYQKIILNTLNLLAKKIKQYTGGLTSSVPIKTAKNINMSNIYIIEFALKNRSINNQINLLNDINYLYQCGKKELEDLYNKTKLFYKTIFLNNLVDTNNYNYNSTLKDGINSFFKIYNKEYDAHNIFINVDYEVFNERINLQGIEFIDKYLECINYENIFCKKFTNIDLLLKKIYVNYEELQINIFENVFIVTILLQYLNKNIFDLNIFQIDISKLYNDYDNDKYLYENNMLLAYINIKNNLNLNENINKYLDKKSKIIIKNIILITENKGLERLLGIK